MTRIIEFSGTVLTGPHTEHQGLWSVDGLLTFLRPAVAPDLVLDGWVIHWSTRTATSGSVPAGTFRRMLRSDRP